MATKRTYMTPRGRVVTLRENRAYMAPTGQMISEQLLAAPSGATGKSNPLMGPLGGPLAGVIA